MAGGNQAWLTMLSAQGRAFESSVAAPRPVIYMTCLEFRSVTTSLQNPISSRSKPNPTFPGGTLRDADASRATRMFDVKMNAALL
jgi:hypothetical protein